jgi:tetratricopeptide (TPR) repeat protein
LPEKIENLSADELYEKGIKASNEGEYDNAIKNLKKATELNLDHKKAFYNLGAVYEKIKE